MQSKIKRISSGVRRRFLRFLQERHLLRLATSIGQHTPKASQNAPVVFFNASTRLEGLSLNAAFSLISGWSLRLQGVPVINFVCKSGMSHCMLGSTLGDPLAAPPCDRCIHQSQVLFHAAKNEWYEYNPDTQLAEHLQELSLAQLVSFQWKDIPLGELVLPGIRWVLRRYHLVDDDSTRKLTIEFILSAENIAREFERIIAKHHPQKVVVFNGISFPEATVRWLALKMNIEVITHEVGLSPFSAFFSYGHATEYPIQLPDAFNLTSAQNEKLDLYLENRFQGKFEMAGIRFWPSIQPLSEEFRTLFDQYRHIVPVFTNVIFDTSQSHANVIFAHMFEWLDTLIPIFSEHPDTLFIIRAHPDELRQGKASKESVVDWVKSRNLENFPNIRVVESQEYINSYELIQRSKFILIYNSTIGMEATLLGTPVIAAGRSRFTNLPTVFFPGSRQAYLEMVQSFLSADHISVPDEFVKNVRRFLYTQLYRVSLPFDMFLVQDQIWNGYVKLKDVNWVDFLPENSSTLKIISAGILQRQPFELDL